MRWQTYTTLAFLFWGVSPICQTLCLKTYGLSSAQWQLIDTCTKVLTALAIQRFIVSTQSDDDSSGVVTLMAWNKLPLWGVFFAVCDGVFGGIAAWSQGQAIKMSSGKVSVSTIVALTAMYPVLTRLIEAVMHWQTPKGAELLGFAFAGLAGACFVGWS